MERISLSILGPACQRVINIALEEYRLVSGVKEEIKNLCTTVKMIKEVLEDAERKQAEDGKVRTWLISLKQVLFDAEDIFDEIATDEALGRDAEDGTLLSKVLNLKDCWGIDALPRNMSALINLRHLIVNEYDYFLVSGIQGLGKLTALHELDGFDCARQPMTELADMGMLRLLRITSLKKVKSREEAAGSRLDKKKHLDVLELEWRIFTDDDLINPGLEEEEEEEDRIRLQAEEVLDGLQPPPHSSIRRLSIYSYRGSRSPSWMDDQVFLARLRELTIRWCPKLRQLPPLPPTLTKLYIEDVGLTHLPGWLLQPSSSSVYSLCSLEISFCPNLEGNDDGEDDQVFSEAPPPPPRRQHHRRPLFLARLGELTIKNCPKLRQLPPLPPTLTKLEIVNVGLTHLPGWQLPPSSLLPSSYSSSPSLSSLKIEDCRELTSLAGGLLRHPLPNLVKLYIYNCEGLVSLPPDTAFGHLTSLKELEVERCPKLAWASTCESPSVEDSGLPPSLESITIQGDCGEVMDQMMLAIVSSGQKLACLRKLHVLGPRMWRSRGTYSNMEISSTWHRRPVSIETCPAVTPPPTPTLRRSLPSSLQELTICDIDQLDDDTLSAWLRGLTSLRSLSIKECPAVTSLPRAEVLSHLTALKKLKITSLKALSSFGGGIHCLVSLEELTIRGCPELLDIATTAADSSRPSSSSALPSPARSVGTSTTRIRKLEISGRSMQQIKTWLLQCPSLQELRISRCNNDVGGDVLLEAALLNLSGTLQRLEPPLPAPEAEVPLLPDPIPPAGRSDPSRRQASPSHCGICQSLDVILN